MTKLVSALLLSAMVTMAAASARAEVPGEDEGRDAAIAAAEKEHAVKAAQMAQIPPLAGQAGVPLMAYGVTGMSRAHSGC